ncbi:MAG: VCBS repeat-containing protein [Acidobacteriota bacterium]|nr:VCBS repeat-containing protein [Acidobacteriota bacterium]
MKCKLTLAAILALSAIAQVNAQGIGTSTTAIDIKEFSFTPSTVDVTNGSQNVTVTVRVTDTERDFRNMSVLFRSPLGVNHGYDLSSQDRISGDGRDGIYRKAFTFYQYSKKGTWQVSEIHVLDGTTNYYRWRDFSTSDLVARGFATDVQVINNNEEIPPEISDFSLTPTTINATSGSRNFTVTFRAKDATLGVSYIAVSFYRPGDLYCGYYDDECYTAGFTVFLSGANRISGDAKDGVYRVVFTVPYNHPVGIYGVSVGASDLNSNSVFLDPAALAARGYSSELRIFRTTPFDYDGDGKADISVWRPSDGLWSINQSTGGLRQMNWGVSGDKLAPADYDGDRKTDIAVWRPSDGVWYRFNSATSSFSTQSWGENGDVPAPADYDGDGKADMTVFRPSTGVWYRINSQNNSISTYSYGQNGDKPVIGDYDGDGRADLAVFRPSNRTWYVQRSSAGYIVRSLGSSSSIPVPADYGGDGKTDIAIFEPATARWEIVVLDTPSVVNSDLFGEPGDIPVPADYNGDGTADLAVFKPSNATWSYIVGGTDYHVQFGAVGDIPTPTLFISNRKKPRC